MKFQKYRMSNQAWLVAAILSLTVSCTQKKNETASQKSSVQAVVPGELVVQLAGSEEEFRVKYSKEYSIQLLDQEMKAYLLKSKGSVGKELKTVKELQSSGDFLLVEPNYVIQANAKLERAPRDPKWLELWGLKNYGQQAPSGGEGLEGADIGALQAWEVSKGSEEVLVGIVDTGIDYTHPDLAQNIWINEKEKNGQPGVDDDSNGYTDDIYGWDFVSEKRSTPNNGQVGDSDPMDDNGHGTHVSGTIGAVGNNGVGVVGVNWKVKLMALKFLSAEGSGGSADEFRAIRYAAKMGVDVVNASYGGGSPSKLVMMAIQAAGLKGMLYVAAAGNDSSNNDETPSFPANYPLANLISVAATDNRDQLAEFSNYGYQTVDIAAPGVNITSTVPTEMEGKEVKNPYATYSGTSMATPHVVGAAALLLAAKPELRKNPAEVKRVLLASGDVLPQLLSKTKSGARLNVGNAVLGKIQNNILTSGTWSNETMTLKTPAHSTEKWDYVWKVSRPGAKALRLHVSMGLIDTAFDTVSIIDSEYRLVAQLPALIADEWLPPVLGDTVYVKFSNAIVRENSPMVKVFPDLNSVDWRNFNFCLEDANSSGETVFSCSDVSSSASIFPNFTTDGVEFDQVGVIY